MQFHLTKTWCELWHPKSSVLVSSNQLVFSQYFTGLSECCALNIQQASTCFFLFIGVLFGEKTDATKNTRPKWYSAWIIVLFKTTVPAISRSFWSLPQVVLDSSSHNSCHCSVRNLIRSTWLWPDYDEFMLFALSWNIQNFFEILLERALCFYPSWHVSCVTPC